MTTTYILKKLLYVFDCVFNGVKFFLGYNPLNGLRGAYGGVVVLLRSNTRSGGITRLHAFLPHHGMHGVENLIEGFVVYFEMNKTRFDGFWPSSDVFADWCSFFQNLINT